MATAQTSQTTSQLTWVERLQTIPHWFWAVAFFVIMVGLQFFLTEFQVLLVGEMLIMGIFALSLNLIMGYGGMVHFGHAAFYGLGGYTVAILTKQYGIDPVLAMIAAPFVSAFVGLIVGWFCVRRVQLYFAILTLAFGQLIYTAVLQARDFTRGDDGIQAIPRAAFLEDTTAVYIFIVVVFLISYIIIRMIVNSPFALILRATRENPQRAQFIAINVRRHQLVTFVIGAFFAGVAGALFAQEKKFVGIEMLFWTESAEPILASLLGGMFSLPGPAIGAALLVLLEFQLAAFTEYWSLVLGAVTVVMVLAAPSGIVGLFERFTSGQPREKD